MGGARQQRASYKEQWRWVRANESLYRDEGYGGSMWIKSKWGQGTRVTIIMPNIEIV
jgi:hypothetical protein